MTSQSSLFDDDADPHRNVPVRVGAVGARPSLTKVQKAFNRWIGRIDEQRRQLVQWQDFSAAFQSRIAQDYEPLRRKHHAQRFMLLRRFDQAHDGGELGNREQSRLARVIVDQVSALLEGDDDPVLIALHDKYSDIRHEDIRRGQADAMKAMVEGVFGATLDGELHSPDDVMKATEQWVASEERGPAPADRPRSARARARIEREQALAEGATQSVREAWRKLASALHPDREQDPAERERKTVLMQRANQAYEARDLLQLLTLQIEAEQIDLTRLAETSDSRLEHYNRVLKEQSEELAAEIDAIIAGYAMSTPGLPRHRLTPAAILDALNQDIAALRRDCQSLAHDLALFKDIRVLKAWLKTLRISRSAGTGGPGPRVSARRAR